jgi:tetratricopeptide (TPR) repeat protein
MNNIANCYAALKRHAEAMKLREETLAIKKRVPPPDHPDTLTSMFNLASSYAALNRHAEAMPLLDEALAKADRPGVDSSVISFALTTRMSCNQKLVDLRGCRATVEMMENRKPTDAPSLYNAACCRAIVASLQAKANVPDAAKLAQDDADKAMAWLTKAVAVGMKDANHIKKDTDLDFLRNRDDFKKLMAELEKIVEPK